MDNLHQTISNDIDNSHMTISKQQIKVSAVKLDPIFGPFCSKIGQNSAAELSSRSTFYLALFGLCGRTVRQLATGSNKNKRQQATWLLQKNWHK